MSENDTKWMKHALCVGVEPEDFFPPNVEDKRRPIQVTQYIEKVCGLCPVASNCLDFAILHEMQGIWGGTTDYTRAQLTKKTNKLKCPGCSGSSLFTEYTGDVICNSCGLSWKSL
jgi:hypothetical protein